MYYSCLSKRLKQSLLSFGLSCVLTGLEWHPGFEDNYGTTNDGIVDDWRRFVCEMIVGASFSVRLAVLFDCDVAAALPAAS